MKKRESLNIKKALGGRRREAKMKVVINNCYGGFSLSGEAYEELIRLGVPVKKYIEQHKGTIIVESEFEKGTKINIQLPVIKKELTTQEKTIIRNEITQLNKRILLVEDEIALSDIQYQILTDAPCSHKVDIAKNGMVAMDLFDRNNYDFVSLDYILPGGITGMDVYKHIRLTDKVIPILFVSGNIEFLESIKILKQED